MHPSVKRHFPLLLAALVALIAAIVWWSRPMPLVPKIPPPLRPAALSMLAEMPDWESLEIYQNTITRAEFEQLLGSVFTTGTAWRSVIQIEEAEARIQKGGKSEDGVFHLRFATDALHPPVPRHWETAAELPEMPPGKPLSGLKIAIDPGHIGGAWAKMEERWFVVGDGQPVSEGDMTLRVAGLLKPQLEALGASVSLVRSTAEPVTQIRPDALLSLAQESSDSEDSPATRQRLAERLFYRTAEIRARAQLVNQTLKPDLVLCLHFNAEGRGNPNLPSLTDRSHFHILLNGAYTDEEVLLADQRFALLEKLLQRTHTEEVFVGSTLARSFSEISNLPAYTYPAGATNVRAVPEQPFLWVRNLLANRLYDCPVIFMEPYVMNSFIDHARIQAGDYEGLREISGELLPSIFREYANALAAGLVLHYQTHRK